jgi:hypothetical protein
VGFTSYNVSLKKVAIDSIDYLLLSLKPLELLLNSTENGSRDPQ